MSIIEIINNCDDSDEHKYTMKYMEIYGINNVRGGLFCNIKLTTSDIDTIIKILNCTMDRCYICGANNHLTNNCMNNLVVINDIDKKIDKLCNCPSSLFKKHRISKCFLNNSIKTVSKIIELFENENDNIDELKLKLKQDSIKLDNKQEPVNINIVITHNTEIVNDKKIKNIHCTRCNRSGHLITNCYANTILITNNKINK